MLYQSDLKTVTEWYAGGVMLHFKAHLHCLCGSMGSMALHLGVHLFKSSIHKGVYTFATFGELCSGLTELRCFVHRFGALLPEAVCS